MGMVLVVCRIGSYNHMQNGNGTSCLQDWSKGATYHFLIVSLYS